MNDLFSVKYDELLVEFNRYVIAHPQFLSNIPDEAMIVLVDPSDPEFNQSSLNRMQAYLEKDDIENRPIIYIDVGELAPIQSRLVAPRVLHQLPSSLVTAS